MNNINSIKNKYAYVLKSIKKDTSLKPIMKDLTGKTYLVSGVSVNGTSLSFERNGHKIFIKTKLHLCTKYNGKHNVT